MLEQREFDQVEGTTSVDLSFRPTARAAHVLVDADLQRHRARRMLRAAGFAEVETYGGLDGARSRPTRASRWSRRDP